MFGWEFPPFKSGGLGTACYGLTKGLAKHNVKVTFVMPVTPDGAKANFVKLVGAENLAKHVKLKKIPSTLAAYTNAKSYDEILRGLGNKKQVYGKNLFDEVYRYSHIAPLIAKDEEHDLIHAHDWMTYQAAINAKKISKKPLVVHLHATEFDRTGGNPDPRISHIEYLGLKAADKIITNSHFSKNNILTHYKIPSEKIDVIHWGIDESYTTPNFSAPLQNENVVLSLGRLTIQKGLDQFIDAAKKVLTYEPHTKFVIAGDGDMLPHLIRKTCALGISDKVIFTGTLHGAEVHQAFKTAKLFVMPSVSEPFGLVALESLKNGTPVLVSKQSGVSEVLKHALKVDFWDVNEMANKIISVLRSSALQQELARNGGKEAEKCDLDTPARKTVDSYKNVIERKH